MKQLTTFFILAISLLSFHTTAFAMEDGAKPTDQQAASEEDQKKKGEKANDDEEPECE